MGCIFAAERRNFGCRAPTCHPSKVGCFHDFCDEQNIEFMKVLCWNMQGGSVAGSKEKMRLAWKWRIPLGGGNSATD
jgi:hypothetical protein